MDRRAFVAIVLATPVAPRAVWAQGPGPRRIGILVLGDENAPGRALIAALQTRLQQHGWAAEQGVKFDVRWAGSGVTAAAQDLVRSSPDVIVAQGIEGIAAVAQQTRSIPTVFVQVTDPVATGLVASLAKPGGNITGVANFPASIAGDRVRVLKDFAPATSRLLFVHDRNYATPPALLRATEEAAKSLGLEYFGTGTRDESELEREIREFAQLANGAIVVFPSPYTVTHSQRIIDLASQHRLPAVYPLPNFAAAGGLVSYGVNTPAMWQETANLVDKILRGAVPGEVGVHVPQVPDVVINLKTAQSLGLTVPAALRARASRVIE